MSSLDKWMQNKFSGKENESTQQSVYTGTYKTVTVSDPETNAVEVLVDNKGKPVAITFAEQILPFTIAKISPDKVRLYQDKYRRGLAGLIDKLVLRVPKH